ncbi:MULTISPECIES: hypothetical protein [unclassified Streptomyces]|uniref:hypothetical protein n=1 Tax=unclassified Streptomyces TaxID=2593676 RepID=UPI003865DE2A
MIVDTRTGEVLGSGVSSGADGPVLHGEVVALRAAAGLRVRRRVRTALVESPCPHGRWRPPHGPSTPRSCSWAAYCPTTPTVSSRRPGGCGCANGRRRTGRAAARACGVRGHTRACGVRGAHTGVRRLFSAGIGAS